MYKELPKKLQKQDASKYWLAYSHDHTGSKSQASEIYTEISKKKFNYYALLSADALDMKYNLVSSLRIQELLKDRNILQAVDLYKTGQYKDAIKLWK